MNVCQFARVLLSLLVLVGGMWALTVLVSASKQSEKSRSVIYDGSRFLGMFMKGKPRSYSLRYTVSSVPNKEPR